MIKYQTHPQKLMNLAVVFRGKFIIKDPAQCPHCGLSGSGLSKIIEYFGLRNMNDGTVRVQSWCKTCRRWK